MVICNIRDHTNLKVIFQGAPKRTSRLATPRDNLNLVNLVNCKLENNENFDLKMFLENLFLVKVMFLVKVFFVKSSYNDDPPISKTCSLTGGQELNGEEADQFGKVGPDQNSLSFVTCTLVTNFEVTNSFNYSYLSQVDLLPCLADCIAQFRGKLVEFPVMSHHHYHGAQIGLDDLESLYCDTETGTSDTISEINCHHQNYSEKGQYNVHYGGGGITMLSCTGSEVLLTNIDRSMQFNMGLITMDACVIGHVFANHRVLVYAGLDGCLELEDDELGQLQVTRPGLFPPVALDDRQLSPSMMDQLVNSHSKRRPLDRIQFANSAGGTLSMVEWELGKEYG